MDLYPPYILRPVCQHTRGHVPSVSAYAYGGLGGIRSMLIHQVGVSTVYVRYDLNYTLQHTNDGQIRDFFNFQFHFQTRCNQTISGSSHELKNLG